MTHSDTKLSLDELMQIESICTNFEEDNGARDRGIHALVKQATERGILSKIAIDHLQHELVKLEQELATRSSFQPPCPDRYQCQTLIGRGGIGEIWRVIDTATQRPVAMKVLHPSLRQNVPATGRLRREALLLGKLAHPGIPALHDLGTLDDGSPFFTMKLVEGQTLAERLRSHDRGGASDEATQSELLDVFTSVAQTIASAHQRGILHRDLKPPNIMTGRFGETQVMDWGLGKFVGEDDANAWSSRESQTRYSDTNDTQAGDVFGTPHYMSPEQARGNFDEVDFRSDVFSLGVMLFEILTRERLYEGDSSPDVLQRAMLADNAQSLHRLDDPSIPHELQQLCRRCLSSEIQHRPNNASTVAEAMRTYTAQTRQRLLNLEAERISEQAVKVEQRKRQRIKVRLVSSLAILATFSAILIAWQWNKALQSGRAMLMAQSQTEHEIETVRQVNEYLDAIFTSTWPENRGDDVTLREVMNDTLPLLDNQFENSPRVEGRIRRTLGDTYRRLDEYEIANEQLRKALNAFRRAKPYDELEVLATMDRLAANLHFDGSEESLGEAEALRREVLAKRIEFQGERHAQTILAMDRLALVLIDQSSYLEAGEMLSQAITLAAEQASVSASNRIDMLNHLGYVQLNTEHEFDAIETLQRILKSNDANLLQKAIAYRRLGEAYSYENEFDLATDMFDNAVEFSLQSLGPLHEETLSAEFAVCRFLWKRKNWPKLLESILDTLPHHIEAYDKDSGDVWELRQLLIQTYDALENPDEALEVLQTAVRELEAERPEHRYTAEAKSMLRNRTANRP